MTLLAIWAWPLNAVDAGHCGADRKQAVEEGHARLAFGAPVPVAGRHARRSIQPLSTLAFCSAARRLIQAARSTAEHVLTEQARRAALACIMGVIVALLTLLSGTDKRALPRPSFP